MQKGSVHFKSIADLQKVETVQFDVLFDLVVHKLGYTSEAGTT